jgi:uncharacterized protein with GYD domain
MSEEFYFTAGRHDVVTLMKFLDHGAAAAAMLRIARSGSATSETTAVYPEAEYRELIERL